VENEPDTLAEVAVMYSVRWRTMMVFKPQTFYGNESDIADVPDSPGAAVETRVADALARAADIDASNVSVTAVGEQIVLQGTVAFPEEVAIAGDIAARVAGVVVVENLITTVNNGNSTDSR
jgi:osmotically-inducible protein OsmY